MHVKDSSGKDKQHAQIDRECQQREGTYKKESNGDGKSVKHSNGYEECLSVSSIV